MNSASILSARLILVAGLACAATACAAEPSEGDESTEATATTSEGLQNNGGGAVGGACTVIAGANKGKSGTFNADGDCEGAWGISECTNQDGTSSGRCRAGKTIIVHPFPISPIVPIQGSSGARLVE